MNRLELAIPPPVVMLVIGLIMWLLSRLFPALALPWGSNVTAAVVLGLAGLAISLAGIASFKRASTTVDPRQPGQASTLVTFGIYRHSRNPMYLGVLLTLIGWAVFLGNVLALATAFAFVPYMNKYQIGPEERLLQEKFGGAFSAYKAKVRRWI
jgi:protein-S-isoprenylcysteine O-methyltransferase Ste14